MQDAKPDNPETAEEGAPKPRIMWQCVKVMRKDGTVSLHEAAWDVDKNEFLGIDPLPLELSAPSAEMLEAMVEEYVSILAGEGYYVYEHTKKYAPDLVPEETYLAPEYRDGAKELPQPTMEPLHFAPN